MSEAPKGRRALLRLAGVIALTALLCLAGWLLMRASVRQMFQPVEIEVPAEPEQAESGTLP